jgi:hypothetical protein
MLALLCEGSIFRRLLPGIDYYLRYIWISIIIIIMYWIFRVLCFEFLVIYILPSKQEITFHIHWTLIGKLFLSLHWKHNLWRKNNHNKHTLIYSIYIYIYLLLSSPYIELLKYSRQISCTGFLKIKSTVIKSNNLPHLIFCSRMLTVVFQINTILGIFHAVISIFY